MTVSLNRNRTCVPSGRAHPMPANRQRRLLALLFGVVFMSLGGYTSGYAACRQDEATQTAPPERRQDSPVAAEDSPPVRAYKLLLKSTVYIEFLRREDEGLMRYRGTGWIVDRDRRLVVTNRHVVEDESTVSVWTPTYRGGKLLGNPEQIFDEIPAIRGRVIDRDSRRDLALVQLPSLPDEMVALPLAEQSPSPGEKVFSLGAWPVGSEGWWIFTAGEVRSVYDRTTALGHVCRVVETQLPTNQGNSGGPVIDDQGRLIAVVEGHVTDARLVSIFVSVEEVKAYLDEVLPLVEPNSAEAFYERGERHYAEGVYRDAALDYSNCLKLESNHVAALSSRGFCHLRLGDLQTAIADFQSALALDPQHLDSQLGMARCRMEQGEIELAREQFTEAIRHQPDLAIAYYFRGEANYQLTELSNALADLNQALSLDDQNIDGFVLRSKVHFDMGELESSFEDGSRAVDLDSSDHRGFQQCAAAKRAAGDLDAAARLYSEAIKLSPDNSSLYLSRGNCYYESDNIDRAEADYVRSIELNESEVYSYWGLGLICRDRQDWNTALKLFTRCIELDADDPDYFVQRASCWDQLGDSDKASQDRAEASRLNRAGG